jgi:phytoene/squalene synthetase
MNNPDSKLAFDHCRELVMAPGSLLEFTSRFLPADRQEPLLALYALMHAIGTIPESPLDEEVKFAKLKWWGEELMADPGASSRHPVLRALWFSKARPLLDNALLLRLVADSLHQIDVVPNSDEKAMFTRLAALGATELKLELALDGAEIESRALECLGAASRMFRIVASLAEHSPFAMAQIPLNMLAQHELSITELEEAESPEKLPTIVQQLAGYGVEWFAQGMASLDIVPESRAGVHLQLRLGMENRQLAKVVKNAGTNPGVTNRYGPADAWFAWRLLRKIQ